jgi:hypothetical protein
MTKLLDRTAYGAKYGRVGKRLFATGEAGAAVGEVLQKPFQALRQTQTVGKMRELLGGKTGSAVNKLFAKGGDATSRFEAANALAGAGEARVGELAFHVRHGDELMDILTDVKKLGVDDGDFMEALQSGLDAPVVQKFLSDPKLASTLERGRVWLAGVRDDINNLAGREIISEADLYAPGVLEQKFRDQFKDVVQRARSARGKVFPQESRKFRPGAALKGVDNAGNQVEHTLVEPALAGGMSVRKQAEEFYRSIHGDDYMPMFNNEAHKALPLYLDAMSHVAGREQAGKLFTKTGVGTDVMDVIESTPHVADHVLDRAASLDGDYDVADLSLAASAGRQLKNSTRLDTLRQRIISDTKDVKLVHEYNVRQAAHDGYVKADQLAAQSEDLLQTHGFLPNVQPQAYELHNQSLAARIEADASVALAKDIRVGNPNLGWGPLKITEKDIDAALKLWNDEVHQFANPAKWGQSAIVEQDMVDMMTAFARFNDRESFKGFLHYYDEGVNYLKRQQLASVGYLNRNYIGGKVMHYLDGIELGAEVAYRKMVGASKRNALGDLPQLDREAFEAWERSGMRRTGQVSLEYQRNVLDKMKANPFSKDFAVYRKVADASDHIEDTLRGVHFTDAYKQQVRAGMTAEAAERNAFDRVIKYQFDYEDLSGFEANVVKRVIPFYTWSRKAIPITLSDMVRKPGKVNNYLALKGNIEHGTELDQFTPNWLLEAGAWNLPLGSGDGSGHTMFMPDTPLNAVDKYLASTPGDTVRDSLSQMTPIIKTPLELWRSRQFFKDIPFTDKTERIPTVYKAIPGLSQLLEGIGWAQRNADGQLVMKDRYSYTIDQYLPLLGRLRRLLPSESKYQERALASWASFLGLALRANTKEAQEDEIWRRFYAAKDSLKDAQRLGYSQDTELPYLDPNDPSTYPDFVNANTVPDFRTN